MLSFSYIFFEAQVGKIPSLSNNKGNQIKSQNQSSVGSNLSVQGSINMANSATNFGTRSTQAGDRMKNLTSQYINKPVQTAPRTNVNPVARGI